MGKLDRTWQLFKESYAVLVADSEILLFPLLSGVSMVLVGASFFFPLYGSGTFETMRHGRAGWEIWVALFAWYYCNYFIGIFFNGALAACANIRLGGGDPTVRDGLRAAFRKVGHLALWALIASTVGLFLRSQQNRNNWLLRLVVGSLGLAWTLITYLIVPVILFENRGVYDSIHRSGQLFRGHWGEEVAGTFGFGLLSFLLCLPAFLVAALFWRYDPVLGIILGIFYTLVLAIVFSAIRGVFTVALYRYAAAGQAPAGFSANLMDEALGGGRRARESSWNGY